MSVKRSLEGALLLVCTLSACGDGKAVRLVATEMSAADPGDEPSTSVSSLLPAPGEMETASDEASAAEDAVAQQAGAALEPSSCDPVDCPEVLLFGVLAPGCCRFGNLCGGRVQVSERTSACLAPEVNEQGEVLRSALTRAARQPFVSDAECPSHTIDGDELRGCCRAGVCGVDTQPWTSSAAALGLQLPRACLDASEAAELADEPASSAPPARCSE